MTCLYEAIEETSSEQDERCKEGISMHRFEQSQEKKPSSRIKHNYPKKNIIGKLDEGMRLEKELLIKSHMCVTCHRLNLKRLKKLYKKAGSMPCTRN
jgi:hypothetical protein